LAGRPAVETKHKTLEFTATCRPILNTNIVVYMFNYCASYLPGDLKHKAMWRAASAFILLVSIA